MPATYRRARNWYASATSSSAAVMNVVLPASELRDALRLGEKVFAAPQLVNGVHVLRDITREAENAGEATVNEVRHDRTLHDDA